MNFAGKKVLVTGGTRGIGEATVRAFLDCGARVAVNYNSTAEGADPVVGQGPSGDVNAAGFQILAKGETIMFTGKSDMLLRGAAPGTEKRAPAGLPAPVAAIATRVEAEAKALRLHWGLPQRILQPGVVLGNASVAWTAGPFWRSMPRLSVSDARGAALLYEQYSHNQLYVYPCHMDHRPGRNGKDGDKEGGHGDVYFANHPIGTGRNLMVDAIDRRSAESIMDDLGSSTATFSVAQLRVLGGAVSRVPDDATAYAHRSRFAMINIGNCCCLLGLPFGIWSLVVLLKPEVAEKFR